MVASESPANERDKVHAVDAATVVSPSFKLWNLFEGSRGGCTAWWMLEKSSLRELLSERYSLHHERGREQ